MSRSASTHLQWKKSFFFSFCPPPMLWCYPAFKPFTLTPGSSCCLPPDLLPRRVREVKALGRLLSLLFYCLFPSWFMSFYFSVYIFTPSETCKFSLRFRFLVLCVLFLFLFFCSSFATRFSHHIIIYPFIFYLFACVPYFFALDQFIISF